jgi:hypothetical protein
MAREKLSEVFPETIRRLAERVAAPVPSWYAGELHRRGNGSSNGSAINGMAHSVHKDGSEQSGVAAQTK